MFQALGPIRLGNLTRGKVLLRVGQVEPGPRLEHDEGAGALAEALVGHRHDRYVADGGVLVENLLDLHHRHLLAAPVDDILDPPGDVQVPVAVEPG